MDHVQHMPGEVFRVLGPGGVGLHVRSWGPPGAPPILFLHGWSGSYLSWRAQFNSALRDRFRLVCVDLRGHGLSDRPADPAAYQNGAAWAGDVQAVMDALALERPILVGWSYGGYVIGDYLAQFGTANVGGINFVGAAVICANPAVHIGPRFLAGVRAAVSDDPAAMLEGLRQVLHLTTLRPPPPSEAELAMGAMALTFPPVRGWMMLRTLDFGPVLRQIDVPCLVSHGTDDPIVLPAMADYILAETPRARRAFYAACGHAPHIEATERFNTDLASLTAAAHQA